MKYWTLSPSVTTPISSHERSHLSKISFTICSLPFSTTTNILSWDSERRISQSFIFFCLVGTLSKLISIPWFPAALISFVEQVIPAAPISCIPTIASVLDNSKVASNNNFSWNGSPTWTAGKSSAESSVISLEAKEAPCIPSLPVREPTIKIGFPTPDDVADIISPFFIIPAEKAFTSGLVL